MKTTRPGGYEGTRPPVKVRVLMSKSETGGPVTSPDGKESKMFIEQYRIGWQSSEGKWKYITVNTKAEMLAEVADKSMISDKVSVRRIKSVRIAE